MSASINEKTVDDNSPELSKIRKELIENHPEAKIVSVLVLTMLNLIYSIPQIVFPFKNPRIFELLALRACKYLTGRCC